MAERTCVVMPCGRPHNAHGLCLMHYRRWQKHGDPFYEYVRPSRGVRPCAVEGCTGITGTPGASKGWCSAHYHRYQRYGDPLGQRTYRQPICDIDGCEKPVVGRVWCVLHYTRWHRYGDPVHRFPWEVQDGKKTCPRCRLDLELGMFGRHTDRVGGVSGYCKKCAVARADEHRRANPAYFQAFASARYASKRGATGRVERFLHAEVFERDGWLCGICDQPIDPDLPYPDPMSASLDHVVPLANGGSHSRENAQAAHFVCNCRKGARTA